MRLASVVVVLAGLCVARPVHAQPLPEQVRLDRYLAEIAGQEQAGLWEQACRLYEEIERERLPRPPDFDLKYTRALSNAHQDRAAHDRLTALLDRLGRDDHRREAALLLLEEVDRRLDAEPLPPTTPLPATIDAPSKAKEDRDLADGRATALLRRGEFLHQQLARAEQGGSGAILAMAGGGAGALVAVAGLALVAGATAGGLGAAGALAGAIVVGGGRVCTPEWAWSSPVVATAAALGLPVVLILASGFASGGIGFAVLAALSLAGGGLLGAGLLWVLDRQLRIADARRAIERFDRELNARPAVVPISATTPPSAGVGWASLVSWRDSRRSTP